MTVPRIACSDCHAASATSDSGPTGHEVATAMASRMRELSGLTAEAERTLLSARRGGVHVGDAQEALDQAIDGQIELQVLVHTFSEGGAFLEKHQEAVAHARDSLTAGHAALDTLSYRRRGLAVSLVFILFVLVALGLKIRQIDQRRG